jgi:hypothetical protein
VSRGFADLLKIISLVTVISVAKISSAQVQTWFDPSHSVTGDVQGARFGSSLSCGVASDPGVPGSSEPLLAVGAPDEDNGAGAVYIYRTKSIGSAPQKLVSPNPGPGKGFGTAILFVNDTDGGGAPELIVTEPNSSGANAKIWAFKSLTGTTFFACDSGEVTLPAGSGESMVNLPSVSGPLPGGSVFVVGSPRRNAVDSFRLTAFGGFPLLCPLWGNGLYTATGDAGSGYGFSLTSVAFSSGIRLFSGAPSYNSLAGRTYFQSQADFSAGGGVPQADQDGSPGELLGLGVAAYGAHLVSSAPGSQSLYVKWQSAIDTWTDVCAVSLPLAQGGPQSLSGTDNIDTSSFGTDQFFAYGIQQETGGSVGFIGTDGSTCYGPRTYNNCIYDEQQEQGSAIAGDGCLAPLGNGTLDNAVVVGSPGWNGGRGRIDIVVRGTQFSSAKTCNTATPTPSPTQTPIPATPTPTPTATPEGSNPGGGGGGGGGGNGDVVLIEPDKGGLPAPVLSALPGGSGVRIELPPVALKDRAALAKLLARRLKISSRRASVLAAQPANLFYQVTIVTTPRAAKKTAFSLSDLLVGDAFASEGRKRRTYNTRNRITIAKTSPGTRVDVSYTVGIIAKGQKTPAYTKSSPRATIQM